jgi:glycosyltransferase involved in cell wall biosynthesis
MRLVVTLLVRDEVDVVAAMIEHHLAAGADFVVATDNGSTDGTVEILEAYRDARVLELLHEPEQTYEQGRWVTRMARRAAEVHGADWVINADADEFWWPRDGDSLATALAIIPNRYGTVFTARENLVADPARDGAWPDRLVLRDLLSLSQRGTRIGGKVCHRGRPDVVVVQGNHKVEAPGIGARWPAFPLTVLHALDRSYAQFQHKIEIGGRSLAANADLDPEFGWHWRADYERLLDGTLRGAWQARQLDAGQVADGLATGRLVRDERLVRRLRDLAERAVVPDALRAVLAGARR